MSLSRFYPVPLPPDGKLPPDQQQAQEEGQHVGNGGGQQGTIQAEPAGQQNSQGNQKHALPGQGNGKGGYRPADPLKERGGGQMQAVQKKVSYTAKQVGTVQVERGPPDELHPDLPGKQLEHEEPHPRNYQGDGGGRAEGVCRT